MRKGSFKTTDLLAKNATHRIIRSIFLSLYRAVGFLDDWQLIQNNCSLRFPFFKTRKTMVPTTTRVIKIFFRDSIGVDRRRNTAR